MKKLIKRIASVLTGLAVMFSVGFFMVSEREEQAPITVSAEEVTERTDYYENENLFYVGNVSDYVGVSSAVGFQISGLTLSGFNLDSAISFVVNSTKIPVLSLDQLVFSADSDGSLRFLVRFYNSSNSIISVSVSSPWFFNTYYNAYVFQGADSVGYMTIPSGAVSMCFGFCFYSTSVPFGTRLTVKNYMVNRGDTVKPYQPSFRDFYNDGYIDGDINGHDKGYKEGYNEGYSNAVNALGTGLLTKGNSTYLDTNLAPPGQGITASATSTGTLTMAFTASYNGILILKCSRQYRNGNKLTITVDSVSSPVIFRTFVLDFNNGTSFSYEVFRLEATSTGYTKEVSIDLPISTNVGFSNFSMVTESVPGSSVIENLSIDVTAGSGDYYQNGYEQGYEEGQTVGYDQGYDKGYQIGKAETLETISDEDLPASVRSFVFSLFDAPVSTFLNAFNLSWDGFDFGGLVAFIFTAVVIVGFVKIWW